MSPPTRLLNQGSLKLLEDCPRKFQHMVCEGVAAPPDPLAQAAALWGDRFHLLAQQAELGLAAERLAVADAELDHCLGEWRSHLGAALDPALGPAPTRQSEAAYSLPWRGYLLTAVYDLLLAGEETAQILDWKTYRRPPTRAELAADWQTRLYLFVLAESGDYPCDRLSLTYWFARFPDKPQTFRYDRAWHDRTRAELDHWIDRLDAWFAVAGGDQPEGVALDLPQVDPQLGRCDRCPFAVRCGRAIAPESWGAIDDWFDLEAIAPVSLG